VLRRQKDKDKKEKRQQGKRQKKDKDQKKKKKKDKKDEDHLQVFKAEVWVIKKDLLRKRAVEWGGAV
jgi:hypothetical protein